MNHGFLSSVQMLKVELDDVNRKQVSHAGTLDRCLRSLLSLQSNPAAKIIFKICLKFLLDLKLPVGQRLHQRTR